MATWKDMLPRALRWLGSDEWNYFVFPDVLLAAIVLAFLLTFR